MNDNDDDDLLHGDEDADDGADVDEDDEMRMTMWRTIGRGSWRLAAMLMITTTTTK